MTFTNQATLSYLNTTVTSNIVAGEVLSPLTISKTASVPAYPPNHIYEYALTIVNTSATAFPAVTVLDNLGAYAFGTVQRFPLVYVDNTAEVQYYTGTAVSAGTLTAASTADGESFVFAIPPQTTAVLTYDVRTTVFAPLEIGSVITNTATVTGTGLTLPLTASYTLPVSEYGNFTITKTAPATGEVGQPFTFQFILFNYGNLPVLPSDFLILSDTLSPRLTDLTVSADGTPWTDGVQYSYNEALGFFQTEFGAIQLPAATFTQDSFGRWSTTPATTTITLSGIVASV